MFSVDSIKDLKKVILKKIVLWDKLLHFVSSGFAGVYSSPYPGNKHSSLFIVIYFIYRVFLFPIKLFLKKAAKKKKNLRRKNTWLISGSINDYNALLPIYNQENSIFIVPNKDIIFRRIFYYKLIWLLPLLYWLIRKKRIRFFIRYYDALGMYEESYRVLKKHKPKKIVFSNDHIPIQIALKMAAHDLGIETYYFQHAAITNAFPQLDFFVSFLDGQDALEKYSNIGKIKGKFELIGSLKARTNSVVRNSNKRVRSIGIAINKNNDISDLFHIIEKIRENLPYISIVIRNHPADKRIIRLNSSNYSISNPINENVFDFLSRIDLLIATNSSIHLEAVLLNVVSVYYKISDFNYHDPLGFVRNGLVYFAESFESLIVLLEKCIINKPDVVHRAAYYDEFINSKCDYEQILAKYGFQVRNEFKQSEIVRLSK